MSGALNSVLGPVGGFIANAALNVGSMAFPPLALANGLGNLMASAVGGAVTGAVDALTKECGMPKFVAGMIKDIVQNILPGHMGQCPPQCGTDLADKVGGKFADFAKDLMSDIVDSFKKFKGEHDKNCGGSNGGGGKSWFVALMQALGEVQNAQAQKVQNLSKEVSDALGAGDDSAGSKQAQFDKMEEFKAEAKLQEVFANITKSIGDAIGNSIATVARSQ